jgi:hypothetical protein
VVKPTRCWTRTGKLIHYAHPDGGTYCGQAVSVMGGDSKGITKYQRIAAWCKPCVRLEWQANMGEREKVD